MLKSAFRTVFFASLYVFAGAVLPAQEKSPIPTPFKAWILGEFPDVPRGLGIDSKGNLRVSAAHW